MTRVPESVLDLCKVFIMHDSLRVALCIREIPKLIIEGKAKIFFGKLCSVQIFIGFVRKKFWITASHIK